VLDPFAGGGSIPLEAQRLGLEAHASDLNPVAVLINKALIEIPPKFAGCPPVNPDAKNSLKGRDWHGAQGLADDIRYYGKWMRDEAIKRIGHLYPKVILPKENGGSEATVIAWLWARTVKCPNPACNMHTPLISSFVLSSKKGKETYLIPQIFDKDIEFSISNKPPDGYRDAKKGLKRGMSAVFECIFCGLVTTRDYTSKEAKAKRLRVIQTAIVAQGRNGRIYLPPNFAPHPKYMPDIDSTGLDSELSPNPRDVWCRNFGLDTPRDLFTHRQLVALTSFSDLVREAREKVLCDANVAGISEGNVSLNDGDVATAYADAVATYLALAVDRSSDYWSALCSWYTSGEKMRNTFTRQAIPMVWDFAEANPFSESTGNFLSAIDWIAEVISGSVCNVPGEAKQRDATSAVDELVYPIVSTDPPYYDNIGYVVM
jgi:putative DNA methylase